MDHVVLALDSRAIGGIETHVLVLGRALADAGIRTTVLRLADHGPHPMDQQAADLGLPLRVLSRERVSLPRWLKASGATLLHTHGYKAGIVGRLTRAAHRLPVVSTFHNGDRGTGKLAAYTAFDRITSRWSKNIAVSDEIATTLPRPSAVIDNFVAMPHDDEQAGWKIGFVGRLSHEKGPDLFLDLARQHDALAFEVFGDGPMRAELQAMAPMNVTFRGNVPGMADHWRELGLLVMPSRREGLPMAALEAMSQGVPVAAFGVGGLPGLIADGVNGYLAAADDMKGLSDRIARFSSSSENARSRMSSAARTRIRMGYSAEARLNDVLTVYRSAMAA